MKARKNRKQAPPGPQWQRRPEDVGAMPLPETLPSDWARVLQLGGAPLDRILGRLGAVIRKLPGGGAAGGARAAQRRAQYPEQGAILLSCAAALLVCPEVRWKGDPQHLVELSRRKGRYENVRGEAGRGLDALLDLRLVLGAVQWYALRAVLEAVMEILESPDTTDRQRERLRTRFSRLLLHKQEQLRERARRKRARENMKARLAAEAEETRQRTLVEATMEEVRQGRMPDRAVLEEAALAWAALQRRE